MTKPKYKLIASDLDGTLLNDELTISERNIAAIKAYCEAGGIFTISTGRSPEATKRYAQVIGLDKSGVDMVCNIGSMIVNAKTMEVKSVAAVDNAVAKSLIEYGEPRSTYAQVYELSGLKIKERTFKTDAYCRSVGAEAEIVGDLKQYVDDKKRTVIKVLLIVDQRNVGEIMRDLKQKFGNLNFVQSTAPLLQNLKEEGEDFQPTMIECFSNEADKGLAVKAVAKSYGIDMKDVAVFGDSYNDISMIETAGFGVAMGNAQDAVKKSADYVADTNNNDGLAKVIETVILGASE